MKKQTSKTTRRTFIKTSALTAGGIMAAGHLPIFASAYGAGSDELKVALIGCGGRGRGAIIQALTADKGTKVVALADAFQDNVDKTYDILQKKYKDELDRVTLTDDQKLVGFDAYKQAIDLADVVILTTPPGFRPIHFEYAVQKGKHVFMEKPVAVDAAGIRKVLEVAKLARQKRLNVVVGLQRRYQKNYLEMKRRIDAGEIGDIVSGQVYWNSRGVWVRERQPEQNEMEYQMRNWYYFNWLCGDHIVEQHVHNIDVANWMIGAYPVKAQGMGGRQIRTGKDHGEIFDHHFVEFTYPNGQVIASQCRHQPNTFSAVKEVFQGTKGNSVSSGGNNVVLKSNTGNTILDYKGVNDPNPYQTEHDELFASIRAGGHIDNTEYGAKSTMTGIMGRMATYSGQVLSWEDALNSEISIMPSAFGWDATPPTTPDENGNYPIPTPGVTKVI